MNELETRLFDLNSKLYREAANPLKSHGPDHHLRVYRLAVELADKMKVDYDAEVLAGAALLHDVAAYYPDTVGDEYHDYDHKIAHEALQGIDFPADKMDAVLFAIANHGSDPKYKNEDEPIEVTLLRDADKLDVFGPIGVARVIMVRSLKGDTLNDIVDDFWTHGHLERKWQSISTDIARDMIREDYEYSKAFFEALATSLE